MLPNISKILYNANDTKDPRTCNSPATQAKTNIVIFSMILHTQAKKNIVIFSMILHDRLKDLQLPSYYYRQHSALAAACLCLWAVVLHVDPSIETSRCRWAIEHAFLGEIEGGSKCGRDAIERAARGSGRYVIARASTCASAYRHLVLTTVMSRG